jgi:hypothetical protein
LQQVPGVSRVVFKESRGNLAAFEVEGQSDRAMRAALARAIVACGWDLNELRGASVSLEDIFLQLTSSDDQKSRSTEAEPDPLSADGERS